VKERLQQAPPGQGVIDAGKLEVPIFVAPLGTIEHMIARRRPATAERPAIIRIRPHHAWVPLDWRELWSYRELAYFLVWRDIKVRYKQTVFGALWAIIQPFMMMVVFSLFIGRISGIAPTGVPYPLFAFAGLVPWTLFSQSVVGSSNSLVASTNLIQKVYFPRLLLPISALGSNLLDFVIAMVVLGLMMLYFGVLPPLAVLWLVPLTALALTSALAIGIWLSALNVKYRDIRYVVPFLIQLGLFASPVAYSSDLVPAQWRALYELNPMAGVLEGFRWALLGQGTPPPIGGLVVSVVATVIILVLGLAYFRRVERTFADVI
jgi:lipopolysaccharide transport system permease protein